jgi:hypothetical protein
MRTKVASVLLAIALALALAGCPSAEAHKQPSIIHKG